tara:strand:- start:404 stop:601 length:198 start_codon:yes stop_codon:yes gene_type:complete
MISAYGVKKVVYQDDYEQNDLDLIKGIFEFNNIEFIQIKEKPNDQASLSEKKKVEIPDNDPFTIR